MPVTYEDNNVTLTSVIYEDEVVSLRDFLQDKAGEALTIDMTECDDVHLALLQLLMAYAKNYPITYEFGEEKKLFQTVLEGFDRSEDHCN